MHNLTQDKQPKIEKIEEKTSFPLTQNIPQELKDRKQWVCFEVKPDKSGKLGKCPKNPHNGKNASCTDPETWGTFDQALTGCQKYKFTNIGFAFTKDDPYCGIDIDHCVEQNNELSSTAQGVLNHFNGTYSERSTSGTGIHLITKGTIPEAGRKNTKLGIEIYNNSRFFVCTGASLHVNPQPILNQQEQINDFFETYFKKEEPQRQALPSVSLSMSDNEIIEKAKSARNGNKFSKLYAGDISDYPSASEANFAFYGIVAFWTQDPVQIANIFQSSRLCQTEDQVKKFKRLGKAEIAKAISRCTKYYTPPKQQAVILPQNTIITLEQQPAELILSQKSPLISAKRLTELNFKQNNLQTIHYCGDAFWKWEGPCYKELKANGVRKIIYDFLKDAKVETKKDNNIVLVDFDPNQSKVNNILDAFKAMCDCDIIPESGTAWIRNDNFPSVDNLIVFKNGILNIEAWLNDKTVQLLPHTPLLMNPSYLPFDFDPLYQEPIAWLKFLNSIWPDDQQSIDTLQEWFGYSLTQNTRFHKILLVVGPPRSGKGTIGRILRALLGDQNVVGPTLSSLAGPFGLQPWINRTHAIISDARLSGKSDYGIITERLLSISGEDPLTIDRKHRDPITTTLPTRITIMSNELPHLGDSSGAIANRYIILPMTNSWLGKEDMDLEIRIRKELPQILLWALEGLKRLKERNRFNQPESARQHFEEIMAMSSPIKAFIADRCELGPLKWIDTKTLFKAWAQWCEDTGHDRPGNLQVFGRNLHTALPVIKIERPRTKDESRTRERHYVGIGLSILPNS